jgi:hypothetical protein
MGRPRNEYEATIARSRGLELLYPVPVCLITPALRSPLSALSTKLTALDGADGPALGSSREEGTEEEEPEMEPEREPDREEEEEEP